MPDAPLKPGGGPEGLPPIGPVVDLCRRVGLLLPLAGDLNPIPMQAPGERVMTVVTSLTRAVDMANGIQMDLKSMIVESGVVPILQSHAKARSAQADLFPQAFRDQVARAAGQRQGGGA